MAEVYKFLQSDLHQPPVPTASFVEDGPNDVYGLNSLPMRSRPMQTTPKVVNYPFEQVEQTPKVGERSLTEYQNLPVRPEEYEMHQAIPPSELLALNPAFDAKNELNDTEIVTHHTGQQVRYKFDPVSGMYVYRGLVYPSHKKDLPMDEKGPIGNDMKYFRHVDRSDYYAAPAPTAMPGTKREEPESYQIHDARFYRPLPNHFDGKHNDYRQTGAATIGNAVYNATRYVN